MNGLIILVAGLLLLIIIEKLITRNWLGLFLLVIALILIFGIN